MARSSADSGWIAVVETSDEHAPVTVFHRGQQRRQTLGRVGTQLP